MSDAMIGQRLARRPDRPILESVVLAGWVVSRRQQEKVGIVTVSRSYYTTIYGVLRM
jgi:hypothetical protein